MKFKDFEYVWRNGGLPPSAKKKEDKMTMKDALATPEAPMWFPKVVTNIIQEAVEPMLIGTQLLTRLQFQPGQFIQFPVMGALSGDFDMAEEEEYPEVRVSMGPGTAITSVGKSGVAVKFSEEILRYSNYDVVGVHLRAIGRALARWKEQKIFNMLSNQGNVSHDNVTPANSLFGTTTGRGLDGTKNGSLQMDDLFEAYTAVLNNGFTPNLLIMNPLTWLMFVQDPILRAFALQSGGGTWFATWTGSPVRQDFGEVLGGRGMGAGREIIPANAQAGLTPSGSEEYSQNLNSAPKLPTYFGVPFTIVVSPFMPYDTENNLTNIIMADSNELGYYIVDHDLVTEDWKNPENDILKIKLKERYTLGVANEGQGVAVIKNVSVTPNKLVYPPQVVTSAAAAIAELDRSVAV